MTTCETGGSFSVPTKKQEKVPPYLLDQQPNLEGDGVPGGPSHPPHIASQ